MKLEYKDYPLTYNGCLLEYNSINGEEPDYSKSYLTFKALEDGTFTLTIPSYVNTTYLTSVSYSLDNGETWTTTNNTSSKVTITTPTVQTGGTVLWKGSGSAMSINSTSNRYSYFSSTGNYSASGNIMSLLYDDVFSGESALSVNYAFAYLFVTNKLVDASNMVLPATELTSNCYRTMFSGCSRMTEAPELPATTLASNCYYTMFYNCTSLTIAPKLPATTLESNCYQSMFSGCSGLTKAPTLPATTLASGCYYSMFGNCRSLTAAPELPVTTMADNCYMSMFSGCSSLTTAPELPATTLASDCYNGMFNGCSGLTEAPELPATTLANGCYRMMFSNCTSLTTAPALPITTLANDCYASMFYGCTALTTAPTLPATTLTEDCYMSMFEGCSNLNNITMLAEDISASNCLNYWVRGVAATGTFTKSTNMATLPTGDSGIPSGWTVENV